MRSQSQRNLPPMEVKPVVSTPLHGDNSLVLKRRLLREAIDESGWKHDAIACALDVDAPYLSKMLAGEKAITLKHLDALPDDVEAIYSRKYAEHHGLICVKPASAKDAPGMIVAGLFGLLGRKEVA